MGDQYILDESGNVIPCNDILEWGRWMRDAERHVGDDRIGDVHISTVFLGTDHAFGAGPPILWETMIFGGEHDGYQERYLTRDEALAGHARALAMVKP